MKRYQIYERSHYDYETKLVGEYNKFEMAKKFVEVVSANEYDLYEEYGKYLTIVDTKKMYHIVMITIRLLGKEYGAKL